MLLDWTQGNWEFARKGVNKGGVELLFSENVWQISGAAVPGCLCFKFKSDPQKANKKPLLLLEKEMRWDDLVVEFR